MVTVQPAVKRIITLIRWSTSPLIVVATMLAGSPAAAQCPDCFHSAMMNDLGSKNRDASKCNGQKYLVLQYDGSLNGKKRQNIDVKVIIQDAMNDWNNATDASGNHVPYKTVFSTDPAITNCGLDVDYTIKLGECAMPTEGLPIAPFACIPNGTNLIHLAEKNFLSKDITTNPMRDINATREDVQGRVAHEIGHPLGLSGNAGCNGPGSAPTIIGGIVAWQLQAPQKPSHSSKSPPP